MAHKATVPFWSADAFLYFIMPRDYVSPWSSELVSRVSSFVDAYVLFDTVVLPERYGSEQAIKELDPNGEVFEYVQSAALNNSDELTKGITIDLSMDLSSLDSLMQEDYKWFSQHDGNVSVEDYKAIRDLAPIPMALLRLWQQSLVNEISDKMGCSSILPLSLQGLEADKAGVGSCAPFHVERFKELSSHYQEIITSVSAVVGEPFQDCLKSAPPFFSIMVDQSLSNSHSLEALRALRADYHELRELSGKYRAAIELAGSVRDKKDVIDEWNRSWDIVVKGDFRKPQLLKKQVSSTDVAKSVVSPQSAGLQQMIQAYLEHRQHWQSYKRFQIYSELYRELDGLSGTKEKMRSVFSVDLVNEL